MDPFLSVVPGTFPSRVTKSKTKEGLPISVLPKRLLLIPLFASSVPNPQQMLGWCLTLIAQLLTKLFSLLGEHRQFLAVLGGILFKLKV